jgi:hypothetical protein
MPARWRGACQTQPKEHTMLLSLLGYVLLGLLLALPLRQLLRFLLRRLGPRSGLYTPQWRYLQPYVPLALRGAAPDSAASADAQEAA